ncbi:nuclear transport factor 2 family protein [Flaviaesturariibacter aridisoli]|uniref:Nuclear transport factor 2 family protein n=1 Tax=Flaviaesturariibacter aridisoli TaxID=2545761 RepID=A0A4R4E5B5_9BACT|nr:nuclear transport factor 2 family protein [Flaviaesturariibacter aridisoli]TCZ74207.1 nuclear transport factor 2 family protein [Flaviaesturariibacter aridisoli]
METLKQKIEHLNALILEGKAMEGFELYYDDEVVMQENETAPTVGKDANRTREIEFFGAITEFRGASVRDVAVGDNVTMVTWKYDYTHKDWGVRNYTQVAVQHWQDGKIVREQFFYSPS